MGFGIEIQKKKLKKKYFFVFVTYLYIKHTLAAEHVFMAH